MATCSETMPKQLEEWINGAITCQKTQQSQVLSLSDCVLLAQFATEEARAAGVPVVFSLADAYGYQRYFFSMENALLISHRLAAEKALTAVSLQMPTHQLAPLIQPGASLYGLQHQKGICCIGGGIPFWSQHRLLGAMGISGGTVEQDITIARHALKRFSAARFALTIGND